MVNWKTTLCGAVVAIGKFLATQPGVLGTVGTVLDALGTAALGYFAADAIKAPAAG